MNILVKRLHADAIIPTKSRDTDEGWDLYSNETIKLPSLSATKVSTGVAIQVEGGDHWLQIEGRSGLSAKGVSPTGGIVDVGYSGEVSVVLINVGKDYIINKGDKIAQAVVRQHFNSQIKEVNDFQESDRGDKGFGSSGK